MRKVVLVAAAFCLLTSPAFATREATPEKEVPNLAVVTIKPQQDAPTLLGYPGSGDGIIIFAKNDKVKDKDKCDVVSPSKPCKGNNGKGNGGGDGSPNGKPDIDR